jgi:hypothetical protein
MWSFKNSLSLNIIIYSLLLYISTHGREDGLHALECSWLQTLLQVGLFVRVKLTTVTFSYLSYSHLLLKGTSYCSWQSLSTTLTGPLNYSWVTLHYSSVNHNYLKEALSTTQVSHCQPPMRGTLNYSRVTLHHSQVTCSYSQEVLTRMKLPVTANSRRSW